MNLYLAVSEILSCDIEDGGWYRIAELVVARNRAQATYLAWKTDHREFSYDLRDKPKFQTRLKGKGVEGPARIASSEHGMIEQNDGIWSL